MPKCFFASAVVILFTGVLVTSGCSASLYSLPAPPPKEEWVSHAAYPDVEKSRQNLRYLEARAAALKLYTALATTNVRDAEPLLSKGTVDYLTRNGELTLADALRLEDPPPNQVLHPLSELLAPDMSNLIDNVPGISEDENELKVEMFSQLKEGGYQRITMIRVGNSWVLDRTEKPIPIEASSQK